MTAIALTACKKEDALTKNAYAVKTMSHLVEAGTTRTLAGVVKSSEKAL